MMELMMTHTVKRSTAMPGLAVRPLPLTYGNRPACPDACRFCPSHPTPLWPTVGGPRREEGWNSRNWAPGYRHPRCRRCLQYCRASERRQVPGIQAPEGGRPRQSREIERRTAKKTRPEHLGSEASLGRSASALLGSCGGAERCRCPAPARCAPDGRQRQAWASAKPPPCALEAPLLRDELEDRGRVCPVCDLISAPVCSSPSPSGDIPFTELQSSITT